MWRAQAVVQLILTVTLVAGIAAAATAVSMGIARAQSPSGISEPNATLVIGMLAAAIAVMVVLSALAVRLTGRPRQR
jgi:hypothetical protein